MKRKTLIILALVVVVVIVAAVVYQHTGSAPAAHQPMHID